VWKIGIICPLGFFGLGGIVETSVPSSLYLGLGIAALGLMLAVTLGIVYLTAVEWRDRRRRDRDKRSR